MSETKEKFNPLAVKIIIPFGRFASKLTKSGEKKLFIAREKTRALLIDRLISGESRGAYLVTGRRGVGKTSFVEACLEEYSNSVYMRFLRADHGRGLPNVFLTALFSLFLLIAYLAASGMLELTVASANYNFLLYPVVAILFSICLSPLFLAFSTLQALIQLFCRNSKMVKLFSVTFLASMIFISALLKVHFDLMKVILMTLINIYLLGRIQVFNTFRYYKPLRLWSNVTVNLALIAISILIALLILSNNILNSYIAIVNLGILVCLPIILAISTDLIVTKKIKSVSFKPTAALLARLISAIATIFLSVVMLRSILALPTEAPNLFLPILVLTILGLVRVVVLLSLSKINVIKRKSSRIDYLFSVLLGTCILAIMCRSADIIYFISVLIFIDIVFLYVLYWRWKNVNDYNNDDEESTSRTKLHAPPFESILLLKSFFLVVGSLQLASPIIKLDFPLRKGVLEFLFENNSPYHPMNLPNSYFGAGHYVELMWLALVFLGLAIIFLVEYSWIMRPFMAERENPVMGKSKKILGTLFSHHDIGRWYNCNTKSGDNSLEKNKENAKRIENFRAITKITLPWLVISAWIPAIIVRINLGFEVLKHQSVIFAMLHGMRTQYTRNLFSPLATSILLINSVKFILLLLVVNMVAHYSFGLYNLAEVDYNYTINEPSKTTLEVNFYNFDQAIINYQQNESKDTERIIDYCSLLPITPLKVDNRGKSDENIRESNSTNKAIWTKALCSAWPDFTNSLLPILYLELVPIRIDTNSSSSREIERFVFWLFHDHHSLPEWVVEYDSEKKELVPKFSANETISFRVYHALLLLVILAIWRWFSSVLPVAPYRRTLAQIDELLEKLTGKRSERRSRSYWAPMGYVRSLFMDNKSSAVEQEMQDPRSVELGFMELLEDIRRSDVRLPFGVNASVSFATPEITFVFDELDKISGATSKGELSPTVIDQEISAMQAEVNRAYAMQNLLSDMKRLITAAPAKFIFVGNRLLHDEWTADQSRRQPLLSSIFDAEFYIPSLMTDIDTASSKSKSQTHLSDRIAEFMIKRLLMAQDVHERFHEDRAVSFAILSKENSSYSYSVDENLGSSHDIRQTLYDTFQVYSLSRQSPRDSTTADYEETVDEVDASWRNSFLVDFVRHLTYRSVGEPKSLELLIAEKSRPLDRFIVLNPSKLNSIKEKNKCRDVLYFNHTSLFHIQLINYIYQHLTERFGARLTGRDDKVAVSLFYIFDFLLKFHNRAFSWANLERIDELAHIHRVPELPELLRELVEGSSERLLHPILNGMYNFRFRSEFAQEISYLSKVSLAEMSALNFTMDEAKSMKATYISDLKETAGEDFDKINALGELYEFDQQHEQAREQYRKAMNVLDKIMYQRLGKTVGVSKDRIETNQTDTDNYQRYRLKCSSDTVVNVQSQSDTQTIIRALLSWDEDELENLLWAVPWGVRRIRLMLQIGMSFELAQDYERAKAHYINARSLASAFFQLYELLLKSSKYEKIGGVKGWRLTVLKDILRHAHLLYQPFLAEAWLGEKMVEVINSSAVLFESELLRLRRTLPFVSQNNATFDDELHLFVNKATEQGANYFQTFSLKNFGGGSGSSFSILLAELHNKTGDLYFYKGYQFKHSLANRNVALDSSKPVEHGTTGYLLRAHFHYAFALHELRRHNLYTKNISKYKYTLPRLDRGYDDFNSIASGQWALIIYQTVFNSLKDLADVTLVRGSAIGCWNGLPAVNDDTLLTDKNTYGQHSSVNELICKYGLYNAITNWLESSDIDLKNKVIRQLPNHSNSSNDTDINWDSFKLSDFMSSGHLTRVVLPLSLGLWKSCNESSNSQSSKNFSSSDNYLRSLEFGKNSMPWQRLVFGLLCARTAADFIAEAGNNSEAAYELLLVMERVHNVIHQFRIIHCLNVKTQDGLVSKDINLSILLPNGKSALTLPSDKHANFIYFMVALAVECVEEYEKQAWLSWRRRPVAQADNDPEGEKDFDIYQLNGVIAPMAATTLVAILLDLLYFTNLFEDDDPKVVRVNDNGLIEKLKSAKNALDDKLQSWLSSDISDNLSLEHDGAGNNSYYRGVLVYVLKRHQYPVLNQLHALKALCNDIALSHNPSQQSSSSSEDGEMLRRYLEDMRILDENYAAPMHFTPYAYAESAALAVLSRALNSTPYDASRIHRRALEKLHQARSAYTMGKQYYANIRRMYYLYDDFNDRRMHANHALLMSSMEIASILEALLSEKEPLQSAIAGSSFIRKSDRENSQPRSN